MNARTDFANNPLDSAVQQRLKALFDLQGILQHQKLPQEQLKLVRDQVSALAPAPKPVSQPLANFPQTLPAYSNPSIQPPAAPTPPPQAVQQAMSQPNLAALLNPATLANLIKTTANRPQATPPPTVASILSQAQPVSTPQRSVTPVTSENPLIASLRARGLLPSTSTPPTATPSGLPFIIPGQLGFTPPAPTPQGSADVSTHVHLSTASIKM
jgi:pre-mRNA cleavage complex 2 protein Pcf11